jgi:hypothetical protein
MVQLTSFGIEFCMQQMRGVNMCMHSAGQSKWAVFCKPTKQLGGIPHPQKKKQTKQNKREIPSLP